MMSWRRSFKLLLRTLAVLVGLSVVGAGVYWHATLPAQSDAFYVWPSAIPAQPGKLLRAEPFTRGIPAGAKGWRILYATAHANGSPALASAIVVAPASDTAEPNPIIAWAHGTTGIVPACAPSLSPQPLDGMPAVALAMQRHWAIVASDYAGLGTAGMQAYLVGADEAHSVLDAVRAARQISGLRLADDVVVWGHSQGGHAALWTGMLATTYAPELRVAGIAALAPATDLPALEDYTQDMLIGRILSSYIVMAYSETYPDVSRTDTLRFGASLPVRDMARRCLDGPGVLPLIADAWIVHGAIFKHDPASGPLGRHLRENIPDGAIHAPVFIAQGLDDPLVKPSIQQAFVQGDCARGQPITYATYAGKDHLSLLAPGARLETDLVNWTQDRFDGVAAVSGCMAQAR
ncbi:MAG TPA: lipase family protein [Dyella sp.]|uniref:lipase family protein n=1 Tax=Dyella sp. TaxID=1869338 RepID=UPI002C18C4DC|nr:lipase family protein [Dyella sp.]HTV85849.1 lipase family protein [Dyella sp.]